MVKRILKIVSIVLASFIIIAGGAIGIVALTGGFEKEVVDIIALYFDGDQTFTRKDVSTLDDIVAKFDFYPFNATETKLILTYSDGNDVPGQNIILDNPPKTVTAGKDFTLKLKKDENGNNIGGVVTITARPYNADPDKSITDAKLKVVVDVNMPDKSLYFAGDYAGNVSLSGKTFTLPKSTETQYVYLRSNIVNAFNIPYGDTNLKSVDISYVYYNDKGGEYERQNLSQQGLQVSGEYNAEDNVTYYYYKIPVVADTSGRIELEAKMHRTSEIEQAFNNPDDRFVDLPAELKSNINSESVQIRLSRYNAFLNKYIRYFDTSEESYAFFSNLSNNGKISLTTESQVKKSFDYVYVITKATINVSAIKLEGFSSTENPREYDVFSENLYSISGSKSASIIDDFGLKIKTDNNEFGDEAEEYLFESLKVRPYLYISATDIDEDQLYEFEGKEVIAWAGKENREAYDFIRVYGFDGHQPVTENHDDYTPEQYPEGTIGYLLQLRDMNEYLYVSEVMLEGEKHWKISCNVPLPNDQVPASSGINKALYLGFEVSGIEEETQKIINKRSYSRLYINYEDMKFASGHSDNITLNAINPNMVITTSGTDADIIDTHVREQDKLAAGRNKQDIAVDMNSSIITNLKDVSYTNVMYFVESTSNLEEQSSKVVSVGKYKFVHINKVDDEDPATRYYKFGDADLIGERIPTYNLDANDPNKKNYYLHALNASLEPVRVFAVVYLSDKNGNPIDTNGRSIKIDENAVDDSLIFELVVIRITDYETETMPSVNINSYVENINFYTKSSVEYQVNDSLSIPRGFINRNNINYYLNEDGSRVDDESLAKIQDFLTIKLLKDNVFTLYVTNFELDGSGQRAEEENKVYETDLRDVYGKLFKDKRTYAINTINNKQIAFNNLCQDLAIDSESYRLYYSASSEAIGTYGSPVIERDEGGNANKIKFMIHLTSDQIEQDTVIYLDPSNSNIPYSSLLRFAQSSNPNASVAQYQRNNWTTYRANKLEVYDVELNLDSDEMQSKVYARYAKKESTDPNDKDINFNFYEATSDTASEEYKLRLSNGNVDYIVTTNIDEDIDNDRYAIVDCSQVEGVEFDQEYSSTNIFFTSIRDYIYHYTKDVNNTTIEYNVARNVITFQQDWTFDNENPDGSYEPYKIFFGTKAHNVFGVYDGLSSKYYVWINEYEVPISVDGDRMSFTITKGTYFPSVGNVAYIYNEPFVITSAEGQMQIKDYIGGEGSGMPINITTNNTSLILSDGSPNASYDATKYIEDDSTYVNSAITVDENNLTEAKVNFLCGEELGEYVLDENGTYKLNQTTSNYEKITDTTYTGDRYSIQTAYVVDDMGEYYKHSNGNKYYYDKNSSDSVDGLRYSKKGVKVYLLITIPLVKTANGNEFTFYKFIEYEILQESVEIVTYNSGGQENSRNNPLEINDRIINIPLKRENPNVPHITTVSYNDDYFFDYVEFVVEQGEISNITCEVVRSSTNSIAESIKITIPNLCADHSFELDMYHKNKPVKTYHMVAKKNVTFEPKDNSIISENNTYDISLPSGSIRNILKDATDTTKGIINEYFNLGLDNIENVELIPTEESRKYCTITEGGKKIELKESYAEYKDNSIVYDYVECEIQLCLNNGDEMILPNMLKIRIIPKNIIDLSKIGNTDDYPNYILDGESIYCTLVRMFNGNQGNGSNIRETTINDIKDNNVIMDQSFYNIFNITPIDGDSECASKDIVESTEGGIIKLKELPTNNIKLKFQISYIEAGSTISKEFELYIRGIDMRYSPSGTMTNPDQDSQTLASNIVINVTEGQSVNIDNYLKFDVVAASVQYLNGIQAVFVDDEGNFYTELDNVTSEQTYKIGYAMGTGNGLELLKTSVGYECTIKLNTSSSE